MEAPILRPPDVKSRLAGKDSDTGNDRRQTEKGVAEDEMVRQHYQLNAHELEQTQRWQRTEKPAPLQFTGLRSWTQDLANEQRT